MISAGVISEAAVKKGALAWVFNAPSTGSTVLTDAILPVASGAVLQIPWSGDSMPQAGGWETSNGSQSAGYNFTHFDNVINTMLGYGAKKVVLVLGPVSFGGKNNNTPHYVFTSGWATSQGVTQLYTCNGVTYAGAGTIPVGTCAQGVDNTAMPAVFMPAFYIAWNRAVAAAINHVKGAPYASKIGYIRVGGTTGGQWSPNAADALLTLVNPPTYDQLMLSWFNFMTVVTENMIAQNAGLSYDMDCAGGYGTYIPNISYEWADGEGAICAPLGIGCGNQGLSKHDIIAFNSQGYASGGTATSGGVSGDWIYIFHTYPQLKIHQLQTDTASSPTNAPSNPTGSLVTLIPFAISKGCTSLELYYEDWQVAYDTTNQYYSEYGAAYASAITTAMKG